jgi:pimeloyl-ACP methyl ester carboxylesterase
MANHSRKMVPLVGMVILIAMVFAAVPVAAQDGWRVSWNACPFVVPVDEVQGETIDCGWLEVPESRTAATTGPVYLAFAVLYSSSPTPPADPIIYLEGGPGGSALAGLDFWYGSALRASHDIILFDQRGTGYSWPVLNCPEMDESDDGLERCRERLVSEGVDLNAYNSRENASDVAALIEALGIDAANLYGVSYGTRLALTVMRDHPQRIRSVIIDGVYPPNVDGLSEQARWANQAFERMFAHCVADPACNAAYPDLRQVFYDTVDMMNASPLESEDPETGELFDMTGDDLVNALFQMFYDGSTVGEMPAWIYDLSDGAEDGGYGADPGEAPEDTAYADSDEQLNAAMMSYLLMDDVDAFYAYLDSLSDDEYYALQDAAYGYIDDDSEGMYTSVECHEDVPFDSYDHAVQIAGGIAPQIARAMLAGFDDMLADCAVWGVQASDPVENAPVVSNIPTLVMSGEYDPITPDAWGEVAAATLSNSTHFVFPTIGHGAVGTHECPTTIAVAFLDNPAATPDGRCIAAMPGTEFLVD